MPLLTNKQKKLFAGKEVTIAAFSKEATMLLLGNDIFSVNASSLKKEITDKTNAKKISIGDTIEFSDAGELVKIKTAASIEIERESTTHQGCANISQRN